MARDNRVIYKRVLTVDDFFDNVVYCNNYDTQGWEEFADAAAKDAADTQDGPTSFTNFEVFMDDHGYADQIADILYEAAKAYVNAYINKTGANFDYC